MASFGLSDGASWGSEAARSRRKRPFLSPSEEEEEDEETGGGGWGGRWGGRDERERPRLPREEEEDEEEEEEAGGRGGRSRPRWDPPRGGSGRSRRRARRSPDRSEESPGPPSRPSAWRSPDPRRGRRPSPARSPSSDGSSCSPAREGGRGRWREGGSRAEAPKEGPWEAAPKRTSLWKGPWKEEQGGHQHPAHARRMMEGNRSQRSSSSPSTYRSKGFTGLEARQDQDHRRRETYPKKRERIGERQRGSDQREGSYGGREWGSPSSSRSKGKSKWEARQDPDHQARETYPKKRARSAERQRSPEPTERGFSSYARVEEGWSSPNRGGEQAGPSWWSPKWSEGREDSPSYRLQSRFDSDLRGSKWDSPELKRRDYERPSTSGKGLEVPHSTSEDLEDWDSSTRYLEEWNLEEGQAVRKNLQGGSGGSEGRPKIYVGADTRAVAPQTWVPRKEVVDFWNQSQFVLHVNMKKYFVSTCPRPTLPDKSGETPVLNPNIMALMSSKQVKDYMVSSHFLRLIHKELLNLLGPVMSVYEMVEEVIEKQDVADPLELREWARQIIRYIGSLNQRLKLQRCSDVLGTINPHLKRMTSKMCGRKADGLLFAENKVKLLKKIVQNFSTLDNQIMDMKSRNDGDGKQGSKMFASHTQDAAAEVLEQISAPQTLVAAGAQREEGVSLELWHRRFGHQDEKAILELQNRHLGVGIRISKADAENAAKCAVCLKVKGPKPPSLPRAVRISAHVLDLIHVDLYGPLPVPSLGNQRYALIFVDDFSRYCVSYLLKEKENIRTMFPKYVNTLKQLFQRKPKAFQMVSGAECLLHVSKAFLEKHGILYSAQGPHAPEESRTSIREMRSLLDMTRCMLVDAALPSKFWAEAFMMATHLLNRLPVEDSKTPYELWCGKTPDLWHLRVFGCLAYAVPKYTAPRDAALETSLYGFRERRKKFGSSAEQTIFLGFISRTKRFVRVMSIKTGKVNLRAVNYFVEEETAKEKGTLLDPSQGHDHVVDPLLGAAASTPSQPVSDEMQEHDGPEGESLTPGEGDRGGNDKPDLLEESPRGRDAPETTVEWPSSSDSNASPPHLNYPADLLLGTEPGTCKEGESYSTGLVDKGFLLTRGEESDEALAPVLQRSTVRMLLSIATSKQMQVRHLEVNTLSQHGDIAEEAAGFLSQDHPNLVGTLRKGLLGQKQAARAWNEKLKEVLLEEGFKQDRADPCLYNRSRNGHLSFILSHTDDLVVATQREQEYSEIVRRLSYELEIKELGDATQYLDTQMKREGDGSCSP